MRVVWVRRRMFWRTVLTTLESWCGIAPTGAAAQLLTDLPSSRELELEADYVATVLLSKVLAVSAPPASLWSLVAGTGRCVRSACAFVSEQPGRRAGRLAGRRAGRQTGRRAGRHALRHWNKVPEIKLAALLSHPPYCT